MPSDGPQALDAERRCPDNQDRPKETAVVDDQIGLRIGAGPVTGTRGLAVAEPSP